MAVAETRGLYCDEYYGLPLTMSLQADVLQREVLGKCSTNDQGGRQLTSVGTESGLGLTSSFVEHHVEAIAGCDFTHLCRCQRQLRPLRLVHLVSVTSAVPDSPPYSP